jgi:PAS domain S-box-containing protein
VIIHPHQAIKVLHVDDDVNISKFLKSFLETFENDIQIDSVSSATKAIEMLECTEFDCVISDYKMPEMNGIELAQKIRDTSNVPIIMYTGQGSEEIAEKAFAVGIDDYLRKEFDSSHYQVLAKRIRVAVEKKRTEKMFKEITERSFDIIFTVNHNGILTYISPAIERVTGYKSKELVGKRFDVILHAEDVPRIINALNEVAGELVQGFKAKLVKKNGSIAFIEINISRIKKNGENIGVQGIARDITMRLEAEQELEKSRQHFQKLFNVIVDPVVIVNKHGYILELSDGVVSVTGRSREELIGKNFLKLDIITERSKLSLITNLGKRLMGIQSPPYVIEVFDKTRKKIPFQVNADVIDYDGESAVMAVFRNYAWKQGREEALYVHSNTNEEVIHFSL